MSYISLTGGAYQSRSIVASAQRCLNLYVEPTLQSAGEPLAFAHYPTPGLSLVRAAPQDICRSLYRASNGDLYACYGQSVYYVDSTGVFTIVGTFSASATSDATPRNTPVSMADNGTTMIVVDGSVDGWTVNLASRGAWTRIVSDGFYGADFVTYISTFFVLNKPGTPIFYVSGSETTDFDPLDFASKVTIADPLVVAVMIHSVVIMLGTSSWESWQLSGGDGTTAGSFPFTILPGNFGNWGSIAKYGWAATSNDLFWLSKDAAGRGVFMQADGYGAKRISTFAIEAQISAYPMEDATAYCYQQQGHSFVVWNFPSALDHRGATWVYDASTDQWAERCYIDNNGIEYRHRGSFATEAYNQNFVGDWENANLYTFDLNNYTDNGQPIKRLRSFPHQIDTDGNRRVMYHNLIANMQVGAESVTGSGPAQEIIDTSFDAADGVLLQSYANYQDIGATFAKVSGINAQILNDAVVGSAVGSTLYEVGGTPTVADYTASFNVDQTNYAAPPDTGSILFLIGRGDPSDLGYKASVSSDGVALTVSLTIMPAGSPAASVALGTLASGYYRVSLALVSTSISVSVYRSVDGKWLAPDATWQGTQTNAIQESDATYTLPGRVLIGGTWVGS